MEITKRDGRIVPYDEAKIIEAIEKAMEETDKGVDAALIMAMVAQISKGIKPNTTVEMIQDTIEEKLMASKRKEVARAYIKYREKRTIARSAQAMSIMSEIVNTKSNDITRENANMNADTPAGMMMKFASETTKNFTVQTLLKEDVKQAIKDNYIHVHDLDYYPSKSSTCVQSPLENILKNGFRAGHGASRPAKRIETASILGCISLENSQNEQHGGQSIPAWDFYMAPYVRLTFEEEFKKIAKMFGFSETFDMATVDVEEYLIGEVARTATMLDIVKQNAINNTVERVHQAMEAFIHNMNTIHSRGGNQVVFSSVNYGTDTSPEGRCVIREMLLSTEEGVGDGETAIFPIQVWKKKRGVNYLKEDRNYDLYELACRVTSKRFFPTFVNLDASFNENDLWKAEDPKRYLYEIATMGCRTRVFDNIFGEKTAIGRGNISFTSINLVKIALEASKRFGQNSPEAMTYFYSELDKYLDISATQLMDRFEFQASAKAKQFPLLMSSLWKDGETLKPEDQVREALKHGSLSIGFIGLAECLIALTGKHHGESDTSQQLGLEIISKMRAKCDEYIKQYQMNFSLLSTPAEGLSGRFVKKDRVDFGPVERVTDKDYYTNSSHVPVSHHCSASHKAKIEGPYHALTNAGHIFYTELDGDATHNPEAIKSIVDLMDKNNIGYGAINHVRSRCLDCGFENADKDLKFCPKCQGSNVDVLQRITGYLVGTTDRWNKGKLSEMRDRVSHTL